MNVCLIHKGKNDTSVIKRYLYNTMHSVQEICLQEISGFDDLKKIVADIVIFDVITIHGNDGDFLLLEKIKKVVDLTPILLATNNGESSWYREKMLDVGVDGCIQAPFLREELLLRLEKLLRRKNFLLFSGTKIGSNHVEMDIRNHIVEVGGERVNLTGTEYSILFHLFLHKGAVVSNKDLSTYLDEYAKKDSQALNVHIFNLRRKIKDSQLIRTVPLYGFTVYNKFASR